MGKYASRESTGTVITWGDITGKPSTFAPTVHDNTAHSPAYATAASPTFTGTATFLGGRIAIGEEDVISGYFTSPESMYFNIDSNNNETGKVFRFGTNREQDSGGLVLVTIQDDGEVILGSAGVLSGYLTSSDSMYFNIDRENDDTGKKFVYATNRAKDTGGTELFVILDTGLVYVPSGGFHVGGTSDPGDNNMIVDGSLMVYSS